MGKGISEQAVGAGGRTGFCRKRLGKSALGDKSNVELNYVFGSTLHL